MLLEVRHVTQYVYDAPVRESVMELWMQPRKGSGQRVISYELELDPPAQLFSYADTFGNAVYHFDVPQPHDQLTIVSRAAVDTLPPAPLPEALDMGEWDRLRSNFVRGENFDFLRPYGLSAHSDELHAFIQEKKIDTLRGQDPLSALFELNQVIYDAFAYETGVTDADSHLDHALKERRGVCQDFAHIMAAVCRSWGVPARYVSGYLFTDRESGDRSSPDATHAWVEVFLPSTRWIGFDPTNNVVAGERHVPAAIGRHYGDVPPSRGVYKGDAESSLAVGVSVRRAKAAISEPEFIRLSQPSASPRNGRRRPDLGGLHFDQQQQQQQ